MPIAPDNFQDWLKETEDMEPVISRLSYEQRKRIDDAAPDRLPGVLAAWDYLEGRITKLNMNIAIPALGLIIIALMLAVVAWAIR